MVEEAGFAQIRFDDGGNDHGSCHFCVLHFSEEITLFPSDFLSVETSIIAQKFYFCQHFSRSIARIPRFLYPYITQIYAKFVVTIPTRNGIISMLTKTR